MATPTPVFPTAVATDAQLKVANNLIQTALTVPMASGDMLIWVNSTAGFEPNCLVSIDSEIIAVSSLQSSPAPALVVATGGRGFDGTTAAAHSSGAKVSLYIVAWHHNVLATEIKAIEGFIGPNGQNIGTGYPFLVATQFNFAAQSPGGPLAPGNNVITLAPVPKGVNGTDTGHYLYISGGAGTTEAVLITGGTAVSGQPSGTVIVNCANAHSGAWTITSATGGIQEAISYANPFPGVTILVVDNTTLYANVVSMGKHVTVQKFAQVTITNLGSPYLILGSGTSHNCGPLPAYVFSSDPVVYGTASSGGVPTSAALDTGFAIERTSNLSINPTYSASAMWLQHDALGTTGTPFGLRAQLNVPNDTSSAGVACVAGYTVMGAGSGTEGIGVHGDCSTYAVNSACVAVNAEGAMLGPGDNGIIYGVVSNIGVGNVGNPVMIGMSIGCNANPNGFNPGGGGINIQASAGSHDWGARILDNTGTFKNHIFIQTLQPAVTAILINNVASSANAAPTRIDFMRASADILARIEATHNNGDYNSGQLKIYTGPAPTLAVTVDAGQLVTVAKGIRTTPIPAAQLPPAATSVGCWACVNDSTSTTVGAALPGGGGTNTVGVFCTVAGWKIVSS